MIKNENEDKDLIKIDGKTYKKQAFIIEDAHPAIGRILIVEGTKFKILDEDKGIHRSGTFLARLTEYDEEQMQEYDEALEVLSKKLVDKVDVKRLIQEQMKNKTLQEIKTGLFILQAQEDGKKVVEEHHRECYNYKIHYMNQLFELISGHDILHEL